MTPRSALTAAVVIAVLTATGDAMAQSSQPFNADLVKAFNYRNLGPFRMGARTSDIAVPDAPAKDHRYTFYVGYWTGGLWKTTNNGTTFEPVFDAQNKLAIGDVALAPSNPNIVWVGTGDAFVSRSSYAGDGVYKSMDGGKTWKNMGLPDSHHIARIVIHPTNPDIVYVAAVGHLYSENPERGVFKTTNGGASWEKVFYINPKIGVIDLILNPTNPDILYAATYDKQRLPWQMVNGGPESAIYKTTNGGRNWTRLAGGLPSGRIGRIGLDFYLRNPDIVYAVIENQNPRTTPLANATQGRGGGAPSGPDARVNTIGGEIYRTADGGQTWVKTNPDNVNVMPKGPYYFTQIRVDPNNEQHIIVTGEPFLSSSDGGKSWPTRIFPRMFGDFRTLWIDPENSDRIIVGSDGGIAISYDGGRTSDHFPNMPVGEIYAIGVDMDEPYNIYAGLQDHEHWRGPSNASAQRGVSVWDWLALGDGDGMFTQVDPKDSRWLYTTRHYGGHTRVDQKLGYETNIVPRPVPGQPAYRFLWATPIHISPHNSSVLYTGGQMLLRSIDRGDSWKAISPDLSTNPTDRIMRESETGVPGGIPWFAISSISESPITSGVIWAGTSDGKVHVTRNNGQSWTDLTAKLTALGAREDGYVSRVSASKHVAGRAYVAKSGYKYDDFRPFLYRTNDFGATWQSIAANLPNEPINVVFEDHKNPNLLFVGNDTGVFVSIDSGAHWVKMNNNMPNVPVHDLLVHPRDNDLVLGTYGRGLWLTNIAPLQELNAAVLARDVHLFTTEPTVQRVNWSFGANDYLFGQRHLQTPNEPNGMVIRYYLKTASSSAASIAITNASGQEVARLEGQAAAGINTVVWNTRNQGGGRGGRGAVTLASGAGAGVGGRGAPGGGGRGSAGTGLDQLAPLGEYTVTLDVAGQKLTQKAQITKTQGWTIGPVPQTIR
jgi:photosystem II stability/assembly factor-like uncharacterized protein